MSGIFVTIVVCLFNIFLWILLLKKVKRIFSTENLIASTRDELNKMIEDINRNTGRDLNLVDAKLNELKSVIAEAEKRINVLNSDFERQNKKAELKASLNMHSDPEFEEKGGYFSPLKSPIERYSRNQLTASDSSSVTSEVAAPEKNQQLVNEGDLKLPNISYAENRIEPKRDLAVAVRELYNQGLDVEFIATKLNTTTTEVQLIIDMNF